MGTRASTFGLGVAAMTLAVSVAATGCTASEGPGTPAPTSAQATSTPAPGTATADPAVRPELLLPEESEQSSAPGFTDWTTDSTTGQAWLLDPCMPTDYPTDQQRTSFRTVSRTGPEAQDARQLAGYPTADVATEVLAGFRRALAACSAGTTPEGSRWQWVHRDVPSLGDDGLLAASTVGGGQFSPAGNRIAVTRVGAVVFLAYSGGEFSTADLDGGADDMQLLAQTFIDSL